MSVQATDGNYSLMWYREYSFKLHKKRLGEIKSKHPHRSQISEPDPRKYNHNKQKVKAFLESEKNVEITKQNQKILDKLSSIKLGKSAVISI